MSLAHFSQKCPSFSFLLTAAGGDTVFIKDLERAQSRQVKFEFLPRPSSKLEGRGRGFAGDVFMRTIDTRFEGNLAYQVAYASEHPLELEAGPETWEDDVEDEFDGSPLPLHLDEFVETSARPSFSLSPSVCRVPEPPASTWPESFFSKFRLLRRAVLCKQSINISNTSQIAHETA